MKQTITLKNEKELVEKYDGKIYAIFCKRHSKALFDVLEEDYIEMVNKGIIDESCTILDKNADIEAIKEKYQTIIILEEE